MVCYNEYMEIDEVSKAYAYGYLQSYIDSWGDDSHPECWIGREDWDFHIFRDEQENELKIIAYPFVSGKTQTDKGITIYPHEE